MGIASGCNIFNPDGLFAGTKNKDSMYMRRSNMRVKNVKCYQNQSNAAAPLAFVFTTDKEGDFFPADKMDEWINNSILEIVKNIEEAPLLVQIYSQGLSILKLQKQQASSKIWPLIKNTWNKNASIPKGIILVEELNNEDKEDMNKTWGLLIQCHGADRAASCYILNTCRTKSELGYCTHFCLAKAKCSGESSDQQLEKAWLIKK